MPCLYHIGLAAHSEGEDVAYWNHSSGTEPGDPVKQAGLQWRGRRGRESVGGATEVIGHSVPDGARTIKIFPIK